MSLAELLEGLKAPEAYREIGDEVGLASGAGTTEDRLRVEIRQTHISVVLLVGGFAWKVKKPVDLGFLDFSTLAKRRRFCEEELRINRRTAPAIYLGLDSIVRDRDGSLRITAKPGDREVLDVAVRMRRLPEGGLLDGQLDELAAAEGDAARSGRVRIGGLLGRFAGDLAAFHAGCPTGPGIDEHGGPEGMRRQFEENLARLAPFADDAAGGVLSHSRFGWLRRRAFDRLEAMRPSLERRVRAGRVREGHGDLHAGNLCEVDGRLLAFDAIEFDRRLRCRDVAAEVAHLAMDLDRRGLATLAARWTRRCAAAAGDREIATLAPLFRFHYAIVRTLVESIRGDDEAVEAAERAGSVVAARRYANLATGYLLPPSLVFTCGLQGAGKSTLARAVAMPLRALVLRSDVIRKRLAGVAIEDRRGIDRHGDDLYGERWTRRTYEAILRSAEAGLARGRHVVVDAAFSKALQREPFVRLAARREVPWCVVEATCDREEIRRRLAIRGGDPQEPSDADWTVYEQAERSFEPPMEIPASHRVARPSGGSAIEAASEVLDRLVAAGAIPRRA